MFISQENVTLYPFSQINFCVTHGIKRDDRWELKHSEIKDCEPACTEHMFVIYRSWGRDGEWSPAMSTIVQQLGMLA